MAPEPLKPLVYGALVTPRVSLEADPLLADAYQHLGVDNYRVGHMALSWAQVNRNPSRADWTSLDLHLHRAHERRMKLSVVIEIIHGGEAEVPLWIWPDFPGWESPDLAREFVRFLHALKHHSGDGIGYLWLGEGPDRYAAAYEDEEPVMIEFLSAVGDSARRIFPGCTIGIMATPAMIRQNGKEPFIRALRDSLGALGLSVYTADPSPILPGPAEAFSEFQQAIAPWTDGTFAILEAGYPSGGASGSTEQKQAEFVSLLTTWLRMRPASLELFCWSPLHDPNPSLAESLALRRHPYDGGARASFTVAIQSMALRRNDGSPKLGRQLFFEEHP